MSRFSAFALLLVAAAVLLIGCASAPQEERLRAEQALRDAEIVKNCDPETYATALELFNAAQEAEKKKEYAKAKELYLEAESKIKPVAAYYRANPDKCFTKKKEEKNEENETIVSTDPESPDNPDMRLPVVHFDFDSYDLRSEEREKIEKVARWMGNFRTIAIRIEGHADERGSIDYNLSLGERRAIEVRRFLQRQGVDEGRVRTISYGEERPAVRDSNEEAWAQNRRAEVDKSNR
ncbi:MAG TPA: OmpA family protein [bacterium]|nr:OmpA family protein [bacterium]